MKRIKRRTLKRATIRRCFNRCLCTLLIATILAGLTDYVGGFVPKPIKEQSHVIAQEKQFETDGKQKEGHTHKRSLTINGRIRWVMITADNNIVQPETKVELISINPVIRSEFQWTRKLKEAKELEAKARIICNPQDISQISYLTVEEMQLVFKGTWMEGKEKDLYNFEHTYGVNAFFIYAVASLESGGGKSNLAKTNCNYYGMLFDGAKWDSWNDCTDYWCKLISGYYYDRNYKSVSKIAPVYCPPTPEHWTSSIESFMYEMYNKSTETVGQLQKTA